MAAPPLPAWESLDLVTRVRLLAAIKGWNERELAKAAHVSSQTIWRMKTGRRSPKLSTLSCIATALGVTVGDLIQ